jgi:hypothetical protein
MPTAPFHPFVPFVIRAFRAALPRWHAADGWRRSATLTSLGNRSGANIWERTARLHLGRGLGWLSERPLPESRKPAGARSVCGLSLCRSIPAGVWGKRWPAAEAFLPKLVNAYASV